MRKFKIWLLNLVIAHLWNGITEEDCFYIANGRLYQGGKPMSDAAIQELASGCKALGTIPAYSVLLREMKMAANRKMYHSSRTQDDIIFGKAVLWTVDVMEKKRYNLSTQKVQTKQEEE